jgi:hypothetical protein
MTTQTAAPVITVLPVKPEDAERFQELLDELRAIAVRTVDADVWTFVRTEPVFVHVGHGQLLALK